MPRTRAIYTRSRAATRGRLLHPQQPLGVAAQYLGLVLVAQRHRLHPFHAGRIDHERPVDREQDAVDAHLLHAAHQRRIGEVAAGGDPEVVAEHVAEADRLRCARPRDGVIDAPHQERQRLAEMAEDDLELRMLLEHAGQHHADRRRRGLHREAPGGAHHHREVLGVVVVVDVADAGIRRGRDGSRSARRAAAARS